MLSRPQSASLDEERREILTTVMDVLAGNPPDSDEMTACSYLLKHLSQTAGRFRLESVMMDS